MNRSEVLVKTEGCSVIPHMHNHICLVLDQIKIKVDNTVMGLVHRHVSRRVIDQVSDQTSAHVRWQLTDEIEMIKKGKA
jgi:hypothetical protein